MPGTKSRRGDSDVLVEGHDLDGQNGQKLAHRVDCLFAPSCRPDQRFGHGRCRHGEVVASLTGSLQRTAGGFMVGVVAVQEPDDHARVEVGQPHSPRSSSSSPGS